MKFSIAQNILAQGLRTVSRAVGSGPATLPILSNIMFVAENGELRLSATDLKIGIVQRLPAMVIDDGQITLPAKLISEFVASLPAEQVEISVPDKKKLLTTVRCGRCNANMRGIDADEFPLLPPIAEETYATLPASMLRSAINQIAFSAANDITKGAANGILLAFDGATLKMVATDYYRLSVRVATLDIPLPESCTVLLPAKAAAELARILPDDDTPVSISFTANKGQMHFHLDDLDVLVSLMNDKFVQYQAILPKASKITVVVATAELQRAIKIAGFFARGGSHMLQLTLAPGQLTVGAQTQDLGDNATVIDADVTGDAMTIGFNNQYLAAAVSALQTTQAAIKLNGPTSPGLIEPVDGAAFQHVLMPITIPGR